MEASTRNQKQTHEKRKAKGKEKITTNDDTRAYFTWNLEMERVLADVLRDQRSLGNQSDGAWKTEAYHAAASILSNTFKVEVSKDNVRNCIKFWRKWYGIVRDILNQSGFDWDDTRYMITVDNDNAWNEYVKTHEEARQFRYKAIPNWYDLVDLCAKDRATGSGAETAQDADNVMSREIFVENINEGTNETIDVDWTSTNQGLEGSSHALKRGQSVTSSTQSQKRRAGEKDGLIASIREVATSLKEFMQATTKKVAYVNEVLDELKCIPNLDNQQWLKAVNWLTQNASQLVVVKALPADKKKDYILAFMS